jgi:hypothetical protein
MLAITAAVIFAAAFLLSATNTATSAVLPPSSLPSPRSPAPHSRYWTPR